MRCLDQIPSVTVSLPTNRIPPMPAARGWRGAHTTPTTATQTTPISREASRQDALETAKRMMGAAWTEPSMVQGTSLDAMTTEAHPLSPQRTAHSEGPTTIPVGRVELMSSNLIWPGHPSMAGNSLFTMDLEPTTIRTDSQERWRLLHPYELEGVLNPTANTPNNLQ